MAKRKHTARKPPSSHLTPTTKQFDLYVDESGQFMETSTDKREWAKGVRQRFASQLAGVLVPRGQLTATVARDIMTQALCAVNRELRGAPHATDETDQRDYNAIFARIISACRARRFQPVRLVNKEAVSYGNRVANYTNMLVELCLRICRQKELEHAGQVSIRVICAKVYMERERGYLTSITKPEYIERLREWFAASAVRRGYAPDSSNWHLDSVELKSANTEPQLWPSDWISNASHADFKRCDPANRVELVGTLGDYDFTLAMRDFEERVDDLIRERALGVALLTIAERLCIEGAQGGAARGANDRLRTILDDLARTVAEARDPHLQTLVGWLHELIQFQRQLSLGFRLTRWMRQKVEQPLRQCLRGQAGPQAETTVDWFAFALRRWALAAKNHQGDLVGARRESQALDSLIPSLADRWEHSPLILEGLLAQAVHLRACDEITIAT